MKIIEKMPSDDNTIKLSDAVANMDIYDSDEESEDDYDFEEPDFESKTRRGSVDDDTEENAEILNSLISEIGEAEPICSNLIRVNLFQTKGHKFVKKNEDVDFDTNEYGYPLIPVGGEEYILPFFTQLKKMRKELKGTKIESNVSTLKFQF